MNQTAVRHLEVMGRWHYAPNFELIESEQIRVSQAIKLES